MTGLVTDSPDIDIVNRSYDLTVNSSSSPYSVPLDVSNLTSVRMSGVLRGSGSVLVRVTDGNSSWVVANVSSDSVDSSDGSGSVSPLTGLVVDNGSSVNSSDNSTVNASADTNTSANASVSLNDTSNLSSDPENASLNDTVLVNDSSVNSSDNSTVNASVDDVSGNFSSDDLSDNLSSNASADTNTSANASVSLND
ncbi:MAG: hypothetical protein ACLFTH_02820, partial [Candidatus Woesearchaeota archaeon]